MPAMPETARLPGTLPSGPLTVSALNRSVRDLLEHRFSLLSVTGEVSNFALARSGHLYFSLKDESAQVRCVMFRHRAQHLQFDPRDGAQVEVRALVTLYEPRGDFQLSVEAMRPAGVGALYEAFVRLRDRLAREGLFDEQLKRALPAFPSAIGVITSPAAAALRDVLTTIARRNPAIPVIVYPAQVQGAAAPAELVAAIESAGRRRECDVLILCRGGGSIEDLWAFNDEDLARAIRASSIPIVVGVGHETDFTIADFAADRRAPTPTAAAELASPDRAELESRIRTLAMQLSHRTRRELERRMQGVDHLARRLVHPGRHLRARFERVSELAGRLARSHDRSIERGGWRLAQLVERSLLRLPRVDSLASGIASLRHRGTRAVDVDLARRAARLDALTQALSHLDPGAVLARGYSIVRDELGAIVTDAQSLKPADMLEITFARGSATAVVSSTRRPDEDTSSD